MGKGDDGKVRSCTTAMGLSFTQIASDCWKGQVRKEDIIRREWLKTHAPKDYEDAQAKHAASHWATQQKAHAESLAKVGGTRDKLYDGVSKDGAGRASYLKERHKLSPQKKSNGPQTSSQSIGWQCDQLPPLRNPALKNHGRKPVIKNGFFRSGGVGFTQRNNGGIPFSPG